MTRQVRVSAPLVAAARLRAALDRRRGIEPSPVIRKLAEATHITVNVEDHTDLTDDVTPELTHPGGLPGGREAARRRAERIQRRQTERAAAEQVVADTQATDEAGEAGAQEIREELIPAWEPGSSEPTTGHEETTDYADPNSTHSSYSALPWPPSGAGTFATSSSTEPTTRPSETEPTEAETEPTAPADQRRDHGR